MDLVITGKPASAGRVLSGWRQALGREMFGSAARCIGALLGSVDDEGFRSSPSAPVCPMGTAFPEVAHAAGAVLATGNLERYRQEEQRDAEVSGPAMSLGRLISGKSKARSGGLEEDG